MKSPNVCTTLLLALIAGFALAVTPFASAQEKPAASKDPLLGAWEGNLDVGPAKLRLVFEYELRPDGKRRGFIISPDQSADRLPITSTKRSGKDIVVEIKRTNVIYTATFDPVKRTMTGDFVQNGKSFPLEMTFAPGGWKKNTFEIDDESRLPGAWTGKLDMGAMSLTMVLKCTVDPKDPDAPLKAVFLSPDQGDFKIPVTKLTLKKGAIRWEVGSIGGAFEGSLDDTKKEMTGTWTQSVAKLPLTLKHTDGSWKRARPQTPKPPFPYESIEVVVSNEKEGHDLAGTLTLPKTGEKFPAVITISGSGPQDRDETLLQHKPFAVIADHLSRNGIAVLRCDDRGVAKSKGDHATATTLDFAGDAWAAVEFLRSRPEIDPDRIGLLGHSEGGVIAPLVAQHHGDVAFMVLLAGPGVPMAELLDQQRVDIGKALGLSDETIELGNRFASELFAMMRDGADEEALKKAAEEQSERVLATLTDEQRKVFEPLNSLGPDQMLTPWFRYLVELDPGPALRHVKCPVLALNGELDVQVAPEPNLEAISRHLKEAGNTAVTIRELEGLNHLFQNATTGNPKEYVEIEETFDPATLELISKWIQETVPAK